jgi:hypothetical protein
MKLRPEDNGKKARVGFWSTERKEIHVCALEIIDGSYSVTIQGESEFSYGPWYINDKGIWKTDTLTIELLEILEPNEYPEYYV